MTDQILAFAVAKAMGRGLFGGTLVSGAEPGQWQHLSGWIERDQIADKLIDEYKIKTEWHYDEWFAVCDGSLVYHVERKTAALMAFCESKGVAYE